MNNLLKKLPKTPSKFCEKLPKIHAFLLKKKPNYHQRQLYFTEILEEIKFKGDKAKMLKDAFLEIEDRYQARQGQEVKTTEMTLKEKEEALSLLKDKSIFQRILDDLEYLGHIGEDEIKLTTYLTASSAITENPICTINKGQSSGGKSHCVKVVKELFPPERIKNLTRITPQALSYFQDGITGKWVIIQEQDGADGAEHNLRVSISEKELTTLVTTKDPKTGKPKTEEISVKINASFTITTTRTLVHAENETRFFSLYVDESEGQTKKILDFQRKLVSNPNIRNEKTRKTIIRTHQNAQRLLKKYKIVIPYAKFIDYPPENVRARRDFMRVLNLIQVIAHLRQYQKTPKNEILEADLEDYAIAHKIFVKILRDSINTIPKNSEKIMEIWLKGDIYKKTKTRRDIQEMTKMSEATVRRYIKPLVAHEIIAEDKSVSPYSYSIIVDDFDKIEEKASITTPEELEENIKAGKILNHRQIEIDRMKQLDDEVTKIVEATPQKLSLPSDSIRRD